MNDFDRLTEKQLREQIAELEQLVEAGEATAKVAIELQQLRRSLRVIMDAKYPSLWQ